MCQAYCTNLVILMGEEEEQMQMHEMQRDFSLGELNTNS